jgi:hypothetical protein
MRYKKQIGISLGKLGMTRRNLVIKKDPSNLWVEVRLLGVTQE